MPVSFRILPARGLVYVRCEGEFTVSGAAEAFAAYARHPEMKPDQKHLLDLSRLTGWPRDYAGLMRLHAGQIDVFAHARHEILYVYYAPEGPGRSFARLAMRSWDDTPGVVTALQETEADALHVLGQPERTIGALLEEA